MTDDDRFAELARTCESSGSDAMLDALAASLATRKRWHALFDARIIQARVAIGLPPVGTPGDIPPHLRDAFDVRSLAACREAGWPLLDEGQIAAGWMYLRAAAEPAEVAARLAILARPRLATAHTNEEADRVLQETLGVVLWDAADPALGIEIVLATQGTCNTITAYEQAVSRLPAARQRPAASVLVAHLHAELVENLLRDRETRGIAPPSPATIPSIPARSASTWTSRTCSRCSGSQGSVTTSRRSAAAGNSPPTPAGYQPNSSIPASPPSRTWVRRRGSSTAANSGSMSTAQSASSVRQR
jgi:hypothetical protein